MRCASFFSFFFLFFPVLVLEQAVSSSSSQLLLHGCKAQYRHWVQSAVQPTSNTDVTWFCGLRSTVCIPQCLLIEPSPSTSTQSRHGMKAGHPLLSHDVSCCICCIYSTNKLPCGSSQSHWEDVKPIQSFNPSVLQSSPSAQAESVLSSTARTPQCLLIQPRPADHSAPQHSQVTA